MMKTVNWVNNMEIAGLDAVRGLLGRVRQLKAATVGGEHHPGSDCPFEGCIRLEHGGDTYLLVIEVKRDGAPRFVRSAVYQLKGYLAHARQSGLEESGLCPIPMLVSPYLSPESRSVCKDHGVAYLDLFGNAHLSFGDVYIDRAVADRPKSETRALRSVFAPKAAAILRVLLRDPARAWRVADLAEAADASLGHVSNVRKALLAREWIEKRKGGIVLAKPDALLRNWREEYRKPAGPPHSRVHALPRRSTLQAAVGEAECGTMSSTRNPVVTLGCPMARALRPGRHSQLLRRRTRCPDAAGCAEADSCRGRSQCRRDSSAR